MVEILSFRHAGVRCAVPSGQVLLIRRADDQAGSVALWAAVGVPETCLSSRVIQVMTPDGPAELHAGDPMLSQVDASRIFGLPALLRAWLPLPHVVGLADVQDEMVWLVDARRLSTTGVDTAAQDPARTAVCATEGDAA